MGSASPYFRFINSGTIDPYISLWGKQPTRYIKAKYDSPIVFKRDIKHISKQRWEEANRPKLIIAGMTKRLESFLDPSGEYLAGKSTTIVLSDFIHLRYIESVLNSKIMSKYCRLFFRALTMSQGYLRIGPPQIKQLPLPVVSESTMLQCAQLAEAVKHAMDIHDVHAVQRAQAHLDALICKIYELDERLF